jgi:hypothetical protein
MRVAIGNSNRFAWTQRSADLPRVQVGSNPMSKYEDDNERPWHQRAAKAVGNDLLADLVRDNRAGQGPSSIIPSKGNAPAAPTNRSGWVDPPQVDQWSPPGQRIVDRMMDQQDAVDRAELAVKLARAKPKGG